MSSLVPVTVLLQDQAATEALAARIAVAAKPGDCILLEGPLGAGKTTFARAFLRAAAADPDLEVPSPTFTLVQSYETSRGPIFHFDLYRIAVPDELVEIGWDEALAEGIVLVEWPVRAGALLPHRRLDVAFRFGAESTSRRVTFTPCAHWGEGRTGFVALQGGPQGE